MSDPRPQSEPSEPLPEEVEIALRAAFELDPIAREARITELLLEHAGCGPGLRLRIAELRAADHSTVTVGVGGHGFDWNDPPTGIGPYRILATLGTGGMGVVYLAEQLEPIRRDVALKVIKLGMDSREVLARFELERQSLALMNHPSIARVYDAGVSDDGQPYFVMEYARGVSLTTFCDEHQLTIAGRIQIFIQVCMAVQHAHQKGVLHRDLKPANILCTREGMQPVVKIIDFGLARATDQDAVERSLYTEQGKIIGTPEYMSPEQARGDVNAIDTRTDVYSLGVILYQLLAGVLPFRSAELRRAGLLEVYRLIQEGEPGKPSSRISTSENGVRMRARDRKQSPIGLRKELQGDLDWIVMKAIAKEPDRRYDSATALAMDLRRFLRHEPVEAGPPGPGYRFGRFLRRFRVQAAAAALVILVLLASVLLVWNYASDAYQQLGIAEEAAALAKRKAAEAERNLALAKSAERQSIAKDEAVRAAQARAETVAAELAASRKALELAERTARSRAAAVERLEAQVERFDETVSGLRFDVQVLRSDLDARNRQIARLEPMELSARLAAANAAAAGWGPAWPSAREAAEAWFREAEAILAWRPRVASAIREASTGEDRPWLQALQALAADLRQFVSARGAQPAGRRRLAWMAVVEEMTQTREEVARAWARARKSIRLADGKVAQRAYGETPIDLSPQTGLVPLGMNPTTGLWEFYHPRSAWVFGEDPGAVPIPKPASSSHRYRGELSNRFAGIVFVLLPGTSVVGKSGGRVRVDPFFIAKHELTQAQWVHLRGVHGPSAFAAGSASVWGTITPRHPVESVTWEEGVRLLQRHGLTLPTEAQWEYGALAGAKRPLSREAEKFLRFAGRPVANVFDRAAGSAFLGTPAKFYDGHRIHAPVGSFPANGFGLFDTAGNVEEWCLDRFVNGEVARRVGTGERLVSGDPEGPRAVRGGSYRDVPARALPTWRRGVPAGNRSSSRGLRAARGIQ